MTESHTPIAEQEPATDLLRGLVEIRSLSTQEAAASHWLAERMAQLGYDRAYVDEAGNAVGEMGDVDAESVVVLLGHIDTVPGDIPVRIENVDGNNVLFGRGSVDAKGPLATFVMAASRLGTEWAQRSGMRIVVVGAVEEEAATSRGARFIRDRFSGVAEPIPSACIIGEPSGWNRVTLDYKGRLLAEIRAGQPMAHTAGPDAGVATLVVAFWNWLEAYAAAFNTDRDRVFDQLQPSLRDVHTSIDADMNDTIWARSGVRLPPDYDAPAFARDLVQWCAELLDTDPPSLSDISTGGELLFRLEGEAGWIELNLRGYEPAWRSPRNTSLVRAFLGAIRSHDARPGFVVKTGTSDMNVVAPVWQCPIVAYGPGDSSLDHTPAEHLSLAEYWRAILVLEDGLRNLSRSLR